MCFLWHNKFVFPPSIKIMQFHFHQLRSSANVFLSNVIDLLYGFYKWCFWVNTQIVISSVSLTGQMMSLECSRGAVETSIPKPGQHLETETNKSENRDLSFETGTRKFVDYAEIFRISGTVASCIDWSFSINTAELD